MASASPGVRRGLCAWWVTASPPSPPRRTPSVRFRRRLRRLRREFDPAAAGACVLPYSSLLGGSERRRTTDWRWTAPATPAWPASPAPPTCGRGPFSRSTRAGGTLSWRSTLPLRAPARSCIRPTWAASTPTRLSALLSTAQAASRHRAELLLGGLPEGRRVPAVHGGRQRRHRVRIDNATTSGDLGLTSRLARSVSVGQNWAPRRDRHQHRSRRGPGSEAKRGDAGDGHVRLSHPKPGSCALASRTVSDVSCELGTPGQWRRTTVSIMVRPTFARSADRDRPRGLDHLRSERAEQRRQRHHDSEAGPHRERLRVTSPASDPGATRAVAAWSRAAGQARSRRKRGGRNQTRVPPSVRGPGSSTSAAAPFLKGSDSPRLPISRASSEDT